MKKVYLILAATVGMTLASCTTNDYVGEEANIATVDDGSIKFGFDMQNATRADIAGAAAADLLGKNFYVTGTKGTEATTYPTKDLVFDNYLVHYEANTAGNSKSNTANWEYVGVTPGTSPYQNYVKLGSYSAQTIKYWDYSTSQYDFLAFSTGTFKAVSTTPADGEIGVTAMKYGEDLATKKIEGVPTTGIAYTFTLPNVDALKQTYVTDIVKVAKANYGKEVTLRFKNLGSKVRMGIYETVPGYSVKDVVFYSEDGLNTIYKGTATSGTANEAAKSATATLISGNSGGLPTNGTIQVIFPHVGTSNSGEADYNKVAGHVTPGTGSEAYHGFGTLTNFAAAEMSEPTGNVYLGRTLPTATFAGKTAADYYDVMFPITSTAPLTLRVDFTLVSIDGSKEEIKVYGAKAVVPSTYLNWLPNYAYTYIFKISDNTNGWTSPIATDPAGLFPITFDAVVAEATDATGEQTTVTTVATPSITTYQQGHTYKTNEYKKATGSKDIYVQVMDNSAVPATLVTTLDATNSLLYEIALPSGSSVTETEAAVMDALEKRTATLTGATNVTGRNGLALTKSSAIDNAVTSIVNDVTDEPITVHAGEAAKITIGSLTAGKSYAYVYDYTTTGAKTEVEEFQPITPGATAVGVTGKTYYTLTTTTLGGITATTAANEAVNNAYIYFSKTTNGTGTTTYSYVSVTGKTKLPEGLIKVAKSSLISSVAGNATPAADTFYFDKYFSNNGKYAVKIIKIVA